MIIRNQVQAPPIRVSRRAAPELTVNQTPSLRALARWLGEMLSPPLSGAEHARVARAILDGLANEDSPQAVAARIEQVADVDEARALAIAQTEMSRINRENQLDVLEQRKGGEDSLVRWRANAKACPRCKARDGETMTVAEARGVLPYHPHCSCKWVRVYAARTRNVFCPTGPGGGVNPTCSPVTAKLFTTMKSSAAISKARKIVGEKINTLLEGAGVRYVKTEREDVKSRGGAGYLKYQGVVAVTDLAKPITVVHEIGHAVDQALGIGKRRIADLKLEERTYWSNSLRETLAADRKKLTPKTKGPSWTDPVKSWEYAYSNPAEAFAHVFSSLHGDDTQVNGFTIAQAMPKTYAAIRDKLAPFLVKTPTANVFCPTGPGGGVDPTCKAGGGTSDVLKAASSHVADSKSTTPEERAILKDAIQKSHTKRQRLQRVFSAKPNWSDGDIVDLDPTSFTGVNVLAGKNAGHIGWKDTDAAIAVVKNPRRGLDVDYSQLEAKASLVSPVEEQETILAGKYKVSVKRAPVPGTKKDSGWGYIRVYELEEVHDVGNTSRSSGARNTFTTTTLNSFFRSCARDAQGRCLPGTAGVAGRVAGNVKRKVLARYQKMEARYGRAGAIAVMAGIVATLPVPVPGSSFAVIGAAEGVRAAYRAVRKLRGKAVTPTPVTNAASFSFADLDAMVEDGWQLVRDIHREYNAELDPRFNRLALRKAIMRELAEQTANVFCPTGKGGGVDPTCKTERGKGAPTTAKEAAVKFPKAGQRVAGLRVSKRVPEKETQIESFRGVTGGRMKVIGVREVPMTAMHRTGLGAVDSPPADPKAKTRWEAYRKRIASLAGHIKRTGVVEPPIVVYDGSDKGSYTLDGDHRIAALRLLGAESFPALVLVDLSRGRVQPAGKGINNWRQFRLMTSNSTVANAFCPTGKGGGVDPTCSKGGARKKAADMSPAERAIAAAERAEKRKNVMRKERKALEDEMEAEFQNYHFLSARFGKDYEAGQMTRERYAELMKPGQDKINELTNKHIALVEKMSEHDRKVGALVIQAVAPPADERLPRKALDGRMMPSAKGNDKIEKSVELAEEFLSKVGSNAINLSSMNADGPRRGFLVGYFTLDDGQHRAFHRGEAANAILKTEGTSGVFLDGARIDAATAVHEWGHALEHQHPDIGRKAREFLRHRVKDEPTVALQEVLPTHQYEAWERGRKDRFDAAFGEAAHYVGKDYGERATEIMSMGLEKLFTDAAGFAKADPEYFNFVVDTIQGRDWKARQ